MKINHYINNRIAAALLLLSLFLLPACSNEEDVPEVEPEQLYTVTLSLNPSTRGATTKASDPSWGVDDDKALEEYERFIKECVVVIFKDGVWYDYLSTGVDTKKITIDNDSQETVNNSTRVGSASVELPAGVYTFFAFANLSSLDIDDDNAGTKLMKELISGEKLTIDELKEKAVILGDDISRFDATATEKTYIPMSSYGEQKIVEADGSLDITLFRMLGKVTVSINNQTTKDLTLNKIEVGQFRRGGSIFLVPYGSGETSLDHLTQNDQNSFNPLFPKQEDGVSISSKAHKLDFMTQPEKIEKGKTNSYTFYEFETRSEQQTAQGSGGSMWIATNITDRDPSLKKLDFSFMRRNDWLNIPVQILETDLETTITGSRMPIGGTPKTITYPAAEAFIPILYHQIDYPGKITISFTFSLEESDGFGDVNFEFAPPQHVAGIQYTEAQLVENSNGLLYDEEKQAALDVPSKIAITETTEVGASATATMTLTTQELAYEGTAQIDLMLAVSYTKNGTSGRITVPYTIKLTNGKTEKGGN